MLLHVCRVFLPQVLQVLLRVFPMSAPMSPSSSITLQQILHSQTAINSDSNLDFLAIIAGPQFYGPGHFARFVSHELDPFVPVYFFALWTFQLAVVPEPTFVVAQDPVRAVRALPHRIIQPDFFIHFGRVPDSRLRIRSSGKPCLFGRQRNAWIWFVCTARSGPWLSAHVSCI